jgi:hypothetical protein
LSQRTGTGFAATPEGRSAHDEKELARGILDARTDLPGDDTDTDQSALVVGFSTCINAGGQLLSGRGGTHPASHGPV